MIQDSDDNLMWEFQQQRSLTAGMSLAAFGDSKSETQPRDLPHGECLPGKRFVFRQFTPHNLAELALFILRSDPKK